MTQTMSFTTTQFDSAAEKLKVFNALKKFILAGMPEEKFTKKLYHHLSLHFGHSAHTSIIGFYDVWFSGTVKRLAFLKRHRDGEIYGDPAHTWSDVQKALRAWLEENPDIIKQIEAEINDVERVREMSDLKFLVSKHPGEASRILKEL